jgi:uncharacterized membrane protein SpoIIM required for sporulation
MTPARFLETRAPAWNRMEELLNRTEKGGVSRLTDHELQELTRVYPAVAVDVARARLYDIAPKTQQRINHLAIAAHGLLYRRPKSKPFPAIWKFYRSDFPQLFRRTWAYTALATVLFMVSVLATFVSVQMRPSRAYLFIPGEVDWVDGRPGLSAEDISQRFRQPAKYRTPMAGGIITNNISVAFNAFALGITGGVGTCFVLLFNGMMLGGFFGHFANHHLSYELWSFLAPHGILEIMTILISAGAGLRLGLSLAIPGNMTRMGSLRAGAKEAVLLVVGTIPFFVVAGIIESFLTPSYLPGELKILVGILTGSGALAYLLLVGHDTADVCRQD